MAKPLEFVWNNELKCKDGFVWNSFMRDSNQPVQGVVAWRVQNPDTYYMAGYDPKAGIYSLFVVTGGQSRLLKAAKLECRTNASNIIEVRFAGSIVAIHRNGERFLVASDSTLTQPGYVGWVAPQGLKSPLVRFTRLKTVEGSYVPTLVTKVTESAERTPWPTGLVAAAFGAVSMAVIGKSLSAWSAEEPRIEEQNASYFTRLDQVHDEYAGTFDKAISAITEEEEEEEEIEEEEVEEDEEALDDKDDEEEADEDEDDKDEDEDDADEDDEDDKDDDEEESDEDDAEDDVDKDDDKDDDEDGDDDADDAPDDDEEPE